MKEKSLAQLLCDAKVLTDEQRYAAETASKDAGIAFEDYVLSHNLVNDRDLAMALADKFDVTFYDHITEKMADPELLAKASLPFLRTNAIMPLVVDDHREIVTANPFAFQSLDELRLLLEEQVPMAIAPRSVIIEAINRYYPLEGTKEMIEELEEEQALEGGMDFGTIEEEDILGMASEAPIIKLVNHILYQAVKQGASDIHIEPSEKEMRVRYRIDGVLYPALTPPKRIQSALSSRIKVMANLNIAEKRQPQDGRIQIKVADRSIDLRVSILPISHGERIVMRLLDKSKTFGRLNVLGLSERDFRVMSDAIARPNGIILLTGPTGSGKTSTLYSILSELNTPDVNIITVEDPVEYQMKGIGQVQVKEQIGLTFAAALRSILRQDPDILMIGETRDHETAQIAIQSSLTGHLVLSTLHTNSAAASITRLIDMGIEPFLIASTLSAVVAQRLVRRLCDVCKKPYIPEKEVARRLGLEHEKLKGFAFYQAVGCEACLNLGYRGRLAIFEVMAMTHPIMRLTLTRSETAVIQDQARKDGMTLLVEDGLEKAKKGLTTIEEVLSVASTV
ncbi:TPA: type II secretion system protein GspE [Candidatus Dependentiae bacterium]|nr:MAG: Type II secretion system protein E (GspE) [candidate division TM6 bacterium GW2011_GWF2_43_87]HBL98541.1 type II secretion system protein GspE [Candidatus Dependentiae bacterium]